MHQTFMDQLDRFKTCLVFADLDLIFKVIVLYVGY